MADRVLGTTLLVAWALTFTLSTHDVIRDAGISSVFLECPNDPEGYCAIAGFRLTSESERDGLRIGDLLVQAGDLDLSGFGPLAVFQAFYAVSPDSRKIPIHYERDAVRGTATLELTSVRYAAPMLPLSLTLALVAALALFRAAPTPLTRIGVPALLVAALHLSTICVGGPVEMIIPLGIRPLVIALTPPLLVLAAMRFPNGSPPIGLNRWWPWLLVAGTPFAMGSGFGIWVSIDTARVGIGVFGVLFLGAFVVVLTRNYLSEGPVGRRQIKWFMWTVYMGTLPLILLLALVAVDPAFIPWAFASIGALCVIPVGLAIGIYRYNWLDIDRLLSTTASINLIAFLGVAIAFVLVPRFAGALSRSLEVGPEAGQMAFSLLFAAAFVPAHRRLRPAIERVLLPDRYAVDLGAAQFQRELLLCSDTQSLVECLGRGLDEVFQSESCVIYSPSGGAWETVFERGLAIPVAIEGDGPLIATLRNRHTPLAIGSDGVRGTPLPDGFDRAVLDTLDAAVVLPITRGESIALVACLGPKRSGDVYAVTDLNLLAALIARVSAKLDRFDHARVEAQSHEMQRALRRYVPGVVVETLASGAKLEAAECEVSVLFADIRGYTAFSEKRGASDIFDAVNRYTETVSEVVRRHAGSVVEFHGDGLMAVFGAPNSLEAKERSAVAAGRAVFAEVSALRGDAIGTELTVGVGIATGTAFVGNIQAIDRMIWSALGNTTNLAARLEGLTRSLGAAIAIDEPTWLAVRDFELGFQCVEDVPIKGRRDHITVYTLPLPNQPGTGTQTGGHPRTDPGPTS